MKESGILLIVIGVFGLIVAMNMDTTVCTPGKTIRVGEFSEYVPSQEVENSGLMDRRRNWLTLSGLAVISGVLLFGFGVLSEQIQVGDKPGKGARLAARRSGQTEPLPPKFDEWGNPLPQPEPDAEPDAVAKFLASE